MATKTNDNNTLVMLLKEPKDWQTVLNHGIYRIRGSLRYPPPMLTEKRVQYLGFYLPASFGKQKFSVRHYAKVKSISMAPRHKCIPDEMQNAKSNDKYYKIDVEEPLTLAEPILSVRGRSDVPVAVLDEKPTTTLPLAEAEAAWLTLSPPNK